MPDEVYNWLVSCFSGHSQFRTVRPTEAMFPLCLKSLSASYKDLALDRRLGDLQAVTPGSLMIRFADDTYMSNEQSLFNDETNAHQT